MVIISAVQPGTLTAYLLLWQVPQNADQANYVSLMQLRLLIRNWWPNLCASNYGLNICRLTHNKSKINLC